MIVSGKLDTHAIGLLSFEKMMESDQGQGFRRCRSLRHSDPGPEKVAAHAGCRSASARLHTQYDSKPCVVYTSIYVDSQVTKWDYCEGKVLDKISIHYNIGHLMTMEGDSGEAEGQVSGVAQQARHRPVQPGWPAASAEPSAHRHLRRQDAAAVRHAAAAGRAALRGCHSADKLKPKVRYKLGWDSRTDQKSPYRDPSGPREDRAQRRRDHVYGTLIRSHITPEIIEVEEGETVSLHFTNVERAEDETHGFAIRGFDVNLSVEPGKTVSATFNADKPGVYPYYCTEFCSALHLEMQGYLLVTPKGYKAEEAALQEGTTYAQGDYDKQVKTNVATQGVIDSVVQYIVARNFKDFPPVVALVEDATDQLNFAADAKKKSEDFAGKQDWQNATLWAQQWFQYQVKAADIGLRAKNYLDQNGAKVVNQ